MSEQNTGGSATITLESPVIETPSTTQTGATTAQPSTQSSSTLSQTAREALFGNDDVEIVPTEKPNPDLIRWPSMTSLYTTQRTTQRSTPVTLNASVMAASLRSRSALELRSSRR